jgi:hypothetical protein
MSRPEDIDEWAWEQGQQFAEMLSAGLLSTWRSAVMHKIAKGHSRALMAERERCAQVAEAYEPMAQLLPFCGEAENKAAATGQHEAAERIAAVIRKGKPR